MIRCERCACWIDTETEDRCRMCGWKPGLRTDWPQTTITVSDVAFDFLDALGYIPKRIWRAALR